MAWGKLGSFIENLSVFLQSCVKQSLAIIQTEQDTRESSSSSSSSSLGEYPEVESFSLRSIEITGGSVKGKKLMPSCHLEDCSNSHSPAAETQPCKQNSPQQTPCQSGPPEGCQCHTSPWGDIPGGRKNHQQKKHWDLRIIQASSTHTSDGEIHKSIKNKLQHE